jgi:hypothetical protein
LQIRRGNPAGAGHLANRRQHLARHGEIDHGREAIGKVRGVGFRQVFRAAESRGAQMRVEIVQTGEQRQSACIDDPCPARRAEARPDGGDAVAPDRDVDDAGRAAGSVEHPRTADQDAAVRRGAEAEEGKQGEKKFHDLAPPRSFRGESRNGVTLRALLDFARSERF